MRLVAVGGNEPCIGLHDRTGSSSPYYIDTLTDGSQLSPQKQPFDVPEKSGAIQIQIGVGLQDSVWGLGNSFNLRRLLSRLLSFWGH